MSNSWALTSERVCVDGVLKRAWIVVTGETITELRDTAPAVPVTDFGTQVIFPGLVDTHVHINEPGRTDWEGFETATHAAAAGGVTTLVDMPLNCIPVTTTRAALLEKLEAIRGRLWVDSAFWGGATADNLKDLPALLASGVVGVKTFMIDSGIPEFPPLDPAGIDQAMAELKRAGLPYLFHAEWDQGESKGKPEGPSYDVFLASRPKVWENNAIREIIRLTAKHNAKSHIVHLSSAEALADIRTAKDKGIQLSVETCPHYLLLSDRSVEEFRPEAERTLFKCCPPIREESNRRALWQGLLDGVIDFVVSDHSPCTPNLKQFGSADFGKAWGGISSLQFTLSLLWTEGRHFGVRLPQLAEWLSTKPARMAGLASKGALTAGKDADILIFDPETSWTISQEGTHHKHKGSPYQGRRVEGRVTATYLRGKKVYENGKFLGQARGTFLLKGNA